MDLITPGLGLLFWQTLTFLVVVLILSKFAWKPILAALNEREQTIETALLAAQNARIEMQVLQAGNQALIEQARQERERIVKQAQESAVLIINESKEKASAEAARLTQNARTEIQSAKNAAMAELRNQVAALSIEIAEKILVGQLKNPDAQHELAQQYLQNQAAKQ